MKEAEVNINYKDALDSAMRLREQACRLREATNKYCMTLEEIAACWEGRNAQRYLADARGRIGAMKRSYERYESLAAAIIKTAELYRKNELGRIRRQKSSR